MASRKIKRKRTVKAAPVNKARALWLNAVEKLSTAQKRSSKVLSGLIAQGKSLQARSQKLALEVGADAFAQTKGAFAPLRVSLQHSAQKVGAGVQAGVAEVLARLGIPSKADIEELTKRITALSRQLKAAK